MRTAPNLVARARDLPPQRFFFVLSLLMLFLVFLGFAPTYYLDPFLDTTVEFHPMPLHLTMLLVSLVALNDLLSSRRIHRATLVGAVMKTAATVATMPLVSSGVATPYVDWIESWL